MWHPQASKQPRWYGKKIELMLGEVTFHKLMKRLCHTQFEEDILLLPFISHLLSDTWGAKMSLRIWWWERRYYSPCTFICHHLLEPRSPNTEYDIVFQQPPKCKQYVCMYLEINGITKKSFEMFELCGCMNMSTFHTQKKKINVCDELL